MTKQLSQKHFCILCSVSEKRKVEQLSNHNYNLFHKFWSRMNHTLQIEKRISLVIQSQTHETYVSKSRRLISSNFAHFLDRLIVAKSNCFQHSCLHILVLVESLDQDLFQSNFLAEYTLANDYSMFYWIKYNIWNKIARDKNRKLCRNRKFSLEEKENYKIYLWIFCKWVRSSSIIKF